MRNNRKPLRTFSGFPEQVICPVCGTSDDGECLLIPILGTSDGNISEGKPVHTGCLNLVIDKDCTYIAQKLK